MKLYLDRTELAPNKGKSVLIVAGGYDLRVEENVEYHKVYPFISSFFVEKISHACFSGLGVAEIVRQVEFEV
jgi:hypothetical protein